MRKYDSQRFPHQMKVWSSWSSLWVSPFRGMLQKGYIPMKMKRAKIIPLQKPTKSLSTNQSFEYSLQDIGLHQCQNSSYWGGWIPSELTINQAKVDLLYLERKTYDACRVGRCRICWLYLSLMALGSYSKAFVVGFHGYYRDEFYTFILQITM